MQLLLKLRLAAALGLFGLQLVGEYLKTVRVLLFSGLLFASVSLLLAISWLSIPQSQPADPLYDVTLAGEKIAFKHYTPQEHQARLNQLLQLEAAQPQHRDILVNISLLYLAQGNSEKAAEYWLAAEAVDPNHPIFTNQPTVLSE